ncbi:MAG: glycosyltransferase family 2 protein [Clostridium sp.]|nr:glycosyltransferase family 2 protein [Clostridium sp.]
MQKLSVTILTFNEEKRIERCLESVRDIADEIIVVDSNSTDRTVEICRRYGCRISRRLFSGYGAMRQYATSMATNSYVFSIDADEVVSPRLAESIRRLKEEGFAHRVYSVSRLNFYCNQPIRHCGWYPDRCIRLFDKRYANWNLHDISEGVIFRDSVNPEPVGGDLLHYPCLTREQYHTTQQRHALIRSRVIAAAGAVAPWTPWLKAASAFFDTYLVKGGVFEGRAGWQISEEAAVGSLTAFREARRLRQKRCQSVKPTDNNPKDEDNPSLIG